MKNCSKWVLGCVVLLFLAGPIYADQDHPGANKTKHIKQFLEITGQIDQITSAYTTILKGMEKDATGNQLNALIAEESLMKNRFDDLEEKIIGVYADHFTDEEIQELIGFVKSPVGSKFIKEQTVLSSEISNITSEWSKEIQDQIAKEFPQ